MDSKVKFSSVKRRKKLKFSRFFLFISMPATPFAKRAVGKALQFTPNHHTPFALVVLTHSSPALRAKTAHLCGSYELALVSQTRLLILHASMTTKSLIFDTE